MFICLDEVDLVLTPWNKIISLVMAVGFLSVNGQLINNDR